MVAILPSSDERSVSDLGTGYCDETRLGCEGHGN
jgi:hypothetical protein